MLKTSECSTCTICRQTILWWKQKKYPRWSNVGSFSSGIFWADYQYFNGCIAKKAKLLVLGGKVARNFLFEKRPSKSVDWEGALFTFNIKDAILEEQDPQILVQSDEPIYQLKVIKDDFFPVIAAASRLRKLFIVQLDSVSSRWNILASIEGLSSQRSLCWL